MYVLYTVRNMIDGRKKCVMPIERATQETEKELIRCRTVSREDPQGVCGAR
jgi:hypothetical protein